MISNKNCIISLRIYNVIFNYEKKSVGILAAKEAVKIVKSLIKDENPKIEEIVEKLKK